MSLKAISLQTSTAFWKSLGIEVPRRNHILKRYKPKSEASPLKRLGVTQAAFDQVYNETLLFPDKLFLKNFCQFFRRDVATVKTWTNTKDASAAFLKLFDIYNSSTLAIARAKYSELAVIFEYYRKGEGQKYSATLRQRISLKGFKTTNIRRRLTYAGGGSKYEEKGTAVFGKERIIWLQRNAGRQKTNKFISLSVSAKTLQVSLTFDAKKEYYIVKSELEKFFKTYLETPQVTRSLDQFIKFLKKGISDNFQLTGCSFLDENFRVFVGPANNRLENVARLDIYSSHIRRSNKPIELFNQIRLSYLTAQLKPILISILTYRDGIFGAILLKPVDKGLTASQRRKFYKDFEKDFNLPLNSFIDYKDLTQERIYEFFLQVKTGKPLNVEARSQEALDVYTMLSKHNLIVASNIVEEMSRVCVNKLCYNKFFPVWDNRKNCASCGEPLVNGKHVEIRSINEKSVAEYLKANYANGMVNFGEKKLLKRPIYVTQVSIGEMSAEFVPVAKNLTDNQLTIFQHRYPNGIILTATDNKELLSEKGFEAASLWEVVHSIAEKKQDKVQELVSNVEDESLQRVRRLANKAKRRILDDKYYEEKNQEVKNFGAELFEADCSTLLDYVLGNSLWLGASHRGISLPDGFAAFPILQSKNGCFIWDTKFSEGKAAVMGEFTKNKRYIEEASKNSSIKINGGLKGFVFISNKSFPENFKKKYLALTKHRRIKVTFLRSHQLKMIVQHYWSYERLILNVLEARNQFTATMVKLFFNTAKKRKCEIVDDKFIQFLIDADKAVFKNIKPGRKMKV
jgi:hypothetical protein